MGTCKQVASATSIPPRDIPFQFNINQGYVLEFGQVYLRIKYRGAYITEATKTVTSVSIAGLFTTSTNHGYSVGDWVYDVGNVGFSGLTWIVASTPAANTFTVTDLFGNVISSATISGAGTVARIYTVVSPYAAVDLPYLKFTQSADTMSLCCVNQATLTEYPPYELTRVGNTNWVFSLVTFGASISPPTRVSSAAQSSATHSTWYSYVVTATDSVTGDESIASLATNVQNNDISVNAGSNTITWSPVAGAAYYSVYRATPSYNVPVPIGQLYGFIGQSYGVQLVDTNIEADLTRTPPLHQDPFARNEIVSVTITSGGTGLTQDTIFYAVTTGTGTGFAGAPVINSGSLVAFIVTNGGSGYLNSDTIAFSTRATGTYTFTGNPVAAQNIVLNGVTWTFVAGTPSGNQTKIQATAEQTVAQLSLDLNASGNASINVASYSSNALVLTITYIAGGVGGNAYTLAAGTYGGSVSGATLAGGASAVATGTLTIGPSSGTYPSVVAYYQQRRVYASTLNRPNTYFFSQPGSFKNMDFSTPSVDDDAIVGNPWAQQVNGIQFMTPMTTGLITLTGNGAWLVNGGNNSAITPSSQTAQAQAYNGSSPTIPPLVINYNMLYVQSKGSIVRDLSFNFLVNVFTGDDKTLLSDHLFNFHQLKQWAYSEEPYKLVWAVRDDGILLSLTYLKEQEIYGWARHDTNGIVVGVCSITEPPVDAVYTIVKRFIPGENQYKYYSERMDDRNWETVEDCFCVDAGLSYPMTYPNATLIPAAADGTDNISAVNLIAGGSGYTAPVVTAVDLIGGGAGATFSVTLSSGVITAINVLTQGQNYVQGSTLVITDITGSDAIAQPIITNNISFTASSAVFSSGNVGDVIRISNNNSNTVGTTNIATNGGGKAVITSFVSSTSVIANITQPITNVVPDDPLFTPVPVSPNEWSISTPVTEVSGLNHLEGMEVAILADGSVVTNQTVEDGAITLTVAASAITIGLPFIAQAQSLYMEVPDQATIQGKRKNIQAVTVRVESSRGFSLGSNQPDQSTQPNGATVPWTNMREVKERNATIQAGFAIPLFTGDIRGLIDGDWATPGQVAIQQTYPLPLNVLALIPEYTAGDTSG